MVAWMAPAAVGMGVASGALGFLGDRSAAKAQAAAIRQRNRAIETAANQTRAARKTQQKYAYRMQQGNIGAQANAANAAIVATSAARGVSGSRTADALKTSNLGQAGLLLEDAAVSDMFARTQIDLEWANMMNQRGGFAGMSTGLSLLNAGLSGLSAGLSAYGAFQS